MSIGIIAFSEKGVELGKRIRAYFTATRRSAELTRCESGGLSGWTREHFASDEALVFIGSCGVAVRAVAPYVKSKAEDPAVVVLDELARFAVSLLSGHLGGANALAEELSRYLDAVPVVTTATDVNGVFAADAWARSQGLAIANPEKIKLVSAKLLAGKTVGFKSDFHIPGKPPDGVIWEDETYDVFISCRTGGNPDALRLVPRAVTAGIGCRKGAEADAIEAAFKTALERAGCHELAVRQICSIDLKKNEPGLLEFCRRRGLPLRTFSASELSAADGKFTASAFVESVTGTDNVCERAAVLGSGGRLFAKKLAAGGVTAALALREPELCFEERA